MRVVAPDGRPETNGNGSYAPKIIDQAPTNGHFSDAMRSWLVSGVHFVDRRRRFGRHGRARELLVVDPPDDNPNASGRWGALAAALHRHTVGGGLSELGPDHQRVIKLAYLEGRTNREIAALLGVSVTTVRRRLWIALGLLEAYIARSGVWLSALLLLAAASAIRPVTRLGHWVNRAAGSSDQAQRVATTLTASAMSAAVLGLVAFTSDSATPGRPQHVPAGPSVIRTYIAAPTVASIESQTAPIAPALLTPSAPEVEVTKATTSPESDTASSTPGRHHNNGCGGDPTNAPPPVPVESHGSGSPVTHPGAGGCHNKG